MSNSITLFELNKNVRESLKDSFPFYYTIVAEISEIRDNQRGHCYLELIEKNDNNIIAKVKATIWASNYEKIKLHFQYVAGVELKQGIKIMFNAGIEFHELYGFSLNITSIDPSYTIGEMAKDKQMIIQRLTDEGVVDMNKEIPLPLVPQKIAIISAPTAAGYDDFINQLENNPFKYKYIYKLFPAVMQGDNAANSIIKALDCIFNNENLFDVVVIIRGGGSQSDLSCFDNYDIALNISQFPLPVLTGIGHERDDTVTDLVANIKLKTPTAVAEFLIDCFNDFDEELNHIKEHISAEVFEIIQSNNVLISNLSQKAIYSTTQFIANEKNNLKAIKTDIKHNSKRLFMKNEQQLEMIKKDISVSCRNFIKHNREKIFSLETNIKYLDPKNVLKKGYSITYKNGKPIKDTAEINKDDIIETHLYKGKIKSKILK